MSEQTNKPPQDVQDVIAQLPEAADKATLSSFLVKDSEGYSEQLVDSIEMIGEEKAAGMEPATVSAISPGMRYLHSSRTIHQLVTDRNRAVGIYIAAASLLMTASGAIYHAQPGGELIIPIDEIQRWCLPITFAILTVLAIFMAFLLIRTRVGLIYEVAKMNALLGLPLGRVSRLSPLSIHFIMQALISLCGGATAGLFTMFMVRLSDPDAKYLSAWIGFGVGLLMCAALIACYIVTVQYTTSDQRLQQRAE
jgi:MFS family permease